MFAVNDGRGKRYVVHHKESSSMLRANTRPVSFYPGGGKGEGVLGLGGGMVVLRERNESDEKITNRPSKKRKDRKLQLRSQRLRKDVATPFMKYRDLPRAQDF